MVSGNDGSKAFTVQKNQMQDEIHKLREELRLSKHKELLGEGEGKESDQIWFRGHPQTTLPPQGGGRSKNPRKKICQLFEKWLRRGKGGSKNLNLKTNLWMTP